MAKVCLSLLKPSSQLQFDRCCTWLKDVCKCSKASWLADAGPESFTLIKIQSPKERVSHKNCHMQGRIWRYAARFRLMAAWQPCKESKETCLDTLPLAQQRPAAGRDADGLAQPPRRLHARCLHLPRSLLLDSTSKEPQSLAQLQHSLTKLRRYDCAG